MPSEGMYHEELIEEYLCNRLTTPQKNQFEEALRQNPDLQYEYQWQREIIRYIQSYRKEQLRHRLNTLVW